MFTLSLFTISCCSFWNFLAVQKKKRWDSSMFTLCSIPSALNNSLWTSLLGRRVLSHSDLIEGSSCLGHIFFVSVFSFLFCWWKVWTAGRQLHCSTTKPCCCKRCTMWFNFVLLKHARPSLFEGSITSKYWWSLSRYASCQFHRHWYISIPEMQALLITNQLVPFLFSLDDEESNFFRENLKFCFIWPQNSFPQFILN